MTGVVAGDMIAKRQRLMVEVVVVELGGKAKDEEKDDQRGRLIKGTRNPEPWWKRRGSGEQRGTIRRSSEYP